MIGMTSNASMTIATAEATASPVIKKLLPENLADHQGFRSSQQFGMMNSPTDGMNTSIEPAITPFLKAEG